MYKNYSQDSSKLKGCSPLQLRCNLKVNCSAIGYNSYTRPLPYILNKANTDLKQK